MTIPAVAALTASLCFAAATIWAGLMDLATMKIRNELVLFLLAIYAALAPLAGFGAVQIGLSAAVAFAALICTFIFFSLRWIGGGDAKLISVVILWLGAEHVLPYVLSMAIFGGVLTLILLRFRAMPLPAFCNGIPWVEKLHAKETGVPYGVAIAAAALFIFPSTPWMKVLS
ncbi:A24 family peptidase [Microvirga guangxiensis]|uniref:Prepilin peptidase CpaA n=1 Tax=Microvirga guangxiensis TaxID=549386 RepID=A0A1G5IAR0_9HYPH|nr:prepilin peptidase [Microvirga guangxiensis]SCY72871.1 prepilin peptidase CpaA [Microvirga guangxiensis]